MVGCEQLRESGDGVAGGLGWLVIASEAQESLRRRYAGRVDLGGIEPSRVVSASRALFTQSKASAQRPWALSAWARLCPDDDRAGQVSWGFEGRFALRPSAGNTVRGVGSSGLRSCVPRIRRRSDG
jgi:hypothetical protein